MAVPKKSLISDREVAKKAVIASNAGETEQPGEAGSLKASALTAQSMKKKSVRGPMTVMKKRQAGAFVTFKSAK